MNIQRNNGGYIQGCYFGAIMALVLFLALPSQAAEDTPTIVMNEIMWDGIEYLELYNPQDTEQILGGWTLLRKRPQKTEERITEFTSNHHIAAHGYFLIEKSEAATDVPADLVVSSLTLLNSGEILILKNDEAVVVDHVGAESAWFAGENTDSGISMERRTLADGTLVDTWQTSTESVGGRNGTPKQTNSVGKVNHPPEAEAGADQTVLIGQEVTLSGEDSLDSDSDTLSWTWDMGDETTGKGSSVTHTYTTAGTYTVSLTVSDGTSEDTDTLVIEVHAPKYPTTVIIYEVLADPQGTDTTGEFIELKNTGKESVDLTGWKLDDADGGSTPYTIPSGTTLPAQGILLLTRPTTKIALNNTKEEVRLFFPDMSVKAHLSYATSHEGMSLNWVSGETYVESTTPTPGTINTITEPEEETPETDDPEEDKNHDAVGKVAGISTQALTLAEVRKQPLGSMVNTHGVVSAPPGVFGEKVLYIAGSGIQVYNADGDFPEMNVGDTIQVEGKLSSIQQEARITVDNEASVSITQEPNSLPTPHLLKTGDVAEDYEGFLVTIQGTVTKTSGDTFYIDDGSGSVKVFIKETTGIDKPTMKKGMIVTVTGIVSQTKSGYRVLPRFQEDIRMGRVAGLTSFPKTGENIHFLNYIMTQVIIYFLKSVVY